MRGNLTAVVLLIALGVASGSRRTSAAANPRDVTARPVTRVEGGRAAANLPSGDTEVPGGTSIRAAGGGHPAAGGLAAQDLAVAVDGGGAASRGADPASDGPSPQGVLFREVTHGGALFRVVEVDPSKARLEVHWLDREGVPLERFSRLAEHVQGEGGRLIAATHGGIYEPGLVPTGLLVHRGATAHRLNTRPGRGNFYLRPGGVFFVQGGAAGVVATDEYRSSPDIQEATQSGPLLVRRGELHGSLRRRSEHLATRAAVGVRPDGTVVLAVTQDEVSLWAVATAMRDGLGCPDALYLDGTLSALYAPALGLEEDAAWPYAGFIAVVERPADGGPISRRD